VTYFGKSSQESPGNPYSEAGHFIFL
jgi:hypothetical protein